MAEPGHFERSRHYSHIGGEDAVEQLQLGQVKGPLQLVVVEGDLPRARAVQPGLHEGGPRVLQQEAAADVVLAHPPGAREHHAAAVVLHRVLPEEEVGEVADVIGGDKVGFCGGRVGVGAKTEVRAKKQKLKTTVRLERVGQMTWSARGGGNHQPRAAILMLWSCINSTHLSKKHKTKLKN